MAQDIGIKTYQNALIKCSNCGSEYNLCLTVENLTIEVCGNCHPFYTGQDTVLDTTGRIEKFQERLAKSQNLSGKVQGGKKLKSRKIRQTLADLEVEEVVQEPVKTIKDPKQTLNQEKKQIKMQSESLQSEVSDAAQTPASQ